MTESGPCAQGGSVAVIAKANCGVPKIKGDEVVYTGTPELMARYAHLAIDSGAKIIGGCCGTSAEHLAAMRVAIDEHNNGARPSLEEIVAGTGQLVNAISEKNTETEADRPGRRRGRRR
jgi:5-methyltetrahydrofolate--homocysteine methyltransferase